MTVSTMCCRRRRPGVGMRACVRACDREQDKINTKSVPNKISRYSRASVERALATRCRSRRLPRATWRSANSSHTYCVYADWILIRIYQCWKGNAIRCAPCTHKPKNGEITNCRGVMHEHQFDGTWCVAHIHPFSQIECLTILWAPCTAHTCWINFPKRADCYHYVCHFRIQTPSSYYDS